MKVQSKVKFKEQLLKVMDQKNHWAWRYLSSGEITREQLKIHFQQEYAVYIRDFPVFLGRIHGKNPPMEVRQDLAANLYEEETGGLTVGKSHPELFLYLMEGLGFKREEFEHVPLFPASRRYRRWLDRTTLAASWLEAAALITLFVEGSVKDRQEIDSSKPKESIDLKQKILEHPLVKFHNVDPAYLDLFRAHHMIEGSHRIAAWKMVLNYAKTPSQQQKVRRVLEHSLKQWLDYRDDVARACKLKPK
jgi:pyrroloquinoline quinone (PQQ) biosynthesis protein C